MNPRVVVLLGSVALNAALFALLVSRPSLAPAALRKYLPEIAPVAAKTPVVEKKADTKAAPRDVWPALYSEDLATFVQRLRAAGFPAAMVRAIVDGEVERRFGPRIRELMRSVNEKPYWQGDSNYFTGNSKLFEDINQIYRERSRLLRDLLGKDMYAYSGMDPSVALQRQYGKISQAKIDLVQRINDDYAEMTGQIRSAMQGVTLPEDREKIALLEREKRSDLAAVLTPEELADYEKRTSQVTMRLRMPLTILDASDTEFQTIYRIHDAFKDTLYPTSGLGGVMTSDFTDKRREATRQIHEQVKAALGEARYKEYQRAADNEFQQLYRLGQRENLPYDTVVRAHDVRGPTAEASIKIIENPALNSQAKLAALKDLAQEARVKLLSTLGPSAGPTYVENNRWLSQLEQGRGLSFNIDGTMSFRSVPMPPRNPQNPKG